MSLTIPLVAADGAQSTVVLPDPVVTVSGGYDNLHHWPGSVNRPVTSGSTLSWIGPLVSAGSTGGYHPSTANDVAQSRALVASGPVTSTHDGQVIEGLDISASSGAGVTIAHNNVTVRQNRIGQAASSAYSFCVSAPSNFSGTVIEDCDLAGPGSPNGVNCYLIAGVDVGSPCGATVARCNLHGAIKTMGQYIVSTLHIDNWCHGWFGDDNDIAAVWFDSHDVVFRHVYADQRADPSGQDSFVNCTTYNTTGTIHDITVDNCAIICIPGGGSHAIIGEDYNGNGNKPQRLTITNNGFFQANQASGASAYCGLNCTTLANSGNYDMANDQATSGALVNLGAGPGVLPIPS